MDHHHHDHADHDHAHRDHHGSHGHSHAPANFGRAFAIGIGLNTVFMLAEVGAGLYGNSVALLADAGHNASDVLGLLVAWIAHWLTRRAPTGRFTYGLRGTSILAALFNALFLLFVVGALSLEAVQRLIEPEPVAGGTVMLVATIGIVVNGLTAMLFASGRHHDLNLKGAYLHMLSDALVSAGVVVGGGLIVLTGWLWLDPMVSLLVNAVIVVGTWGLLRDSIGMALQAVPASIKPEAVRSFLLGQSGVTGLHDLHIWPISTTEVALTAHLVVGAPAASDAFLGTVSRALRDRFGIAHATLQIETGLETCLLAADDHACSVLGDA